MNSIEQFNKLSFICEWYHEDDKNIPRTFIFYYYLSDSTIEMYDQKNKRTFLRRTKLDDVTESHFYCGAKLNILGRQIEIIECADQLTKDRLMQTRQKTFCLLKPHVIPIMGRILTLLVKENFSINHCVLLKLDSGTVREMYGANPDYDAENDPNLALHIDHLISAPVLAMELVSENAIERLTNFTGPNERQDAITTAPNSLRAKFAEDSILNVLYCSANDVTARKNLELFFPSTSTITTTLNCNNRNKNRFRTTARFSQSTIGLIKPHAVYSGQFGDIITMILENDLQISAMELFRLERMNCEEFYEVYKGVVPEYIQMVLELANGPFIAMEIVCKKNPSAVHKMFRELCGPIDPEIGREIRPNTIRAKFGKNKVKNAIHCTDLPEDVELEVEYFFKIMQ